MDGVALPEGLSVLSEAECRALLATAEIGRVVISLGALPAALPVTYRLIGDAIVFRTSDGTKLTAAVDQAVVAFEVDELDPATRSGWSVLIVGTSRVVTDPEELAELAEAGVHSWLVEQPKHYVKIDMRQISGRRLRRPNAAHADLARNGANAQPARDAADVGPAQ